MLIQTLSELCQGYFHIDECFEWKQEDGCLMDDKCRRMTVRGLLHWCDAEQKTLFVRKYENVFLGSTETNLHVEDLMCADVDLHQALSSMDGAGTVMTLFISYQPCHHSSGGRKMERLHTKSCTKLLQKWFRTVILPLKIVFRVKICGLYRAHWVDATLFSRENDAVIFGNKSYQAREGIIMLKQEPNFILEAMNEADWRQLTQFCHPDVLEQITSEQWRKRFVYDCHTRKFLNEL